MFPKYDIGKKGEHYVMDVFTNCGFDAELNNDYEKRYDYDLSVNLLGLKFTIEVKHDIMAIKTKNVAIEYHNSKKNQPSGINATLADVWVQLVTYPNTEIFAYAISVKNLKRYILEHEPHKHIISGGEKNSNIYIYKMVDILPHFVRIDNITNPSILKSTLESILYD